MKYLTDDDRALLGAAISFIKTSDLSYDALNNVNGLPLVDELIKLNQNGIDFGYLCDSLLKGEAENLKLSQLVKKIKDKMNEDRKKHLEDEIIIGDTQHKNEIKEISDKEISEDEKDLLNSVSNEMLELLRDTDEETIKKLFK